MKRIEIVNMYRILGRIKLNKITDKDLRNTIISDHLKMFRIAKENDEYIAALRGQFDPSAVKELNEAYDTYASEEVPIELKKISRDAFADIVVASDIDFTLAEMAGLQPLFDDI